MMALNPKMLEAHPVLLTRKGYEQKQQRLNECRHQLHKELPRRMKQAKEHDSELLENREFIDFETQRELLEAEVDYLEELLLRARIINENDINTKYIEVGVRVVLESQSPRRRTIIELVGPAEVDIEHMRISTRSPLGLQLLGKQKGSTVTVRTASGAMTYKIVDIQKAD